MSRPRKDLEHTLWQPLGEIVSFLRGRGIPRPLQKDAWNKHWSMPEGERALAGLPAATSNSKTETKNILQNLFRKSESWGVVC